MTVIPLPILRAQTVLRPATLPARTPLATAHPATVVDRPTALALAVYGKNRPPC